MACSVIAQERRFQIDASGGVVQDRIAGCDMAVVARDSGLMELLFLCPRVKPRMTGGKEHVRECKCERETQ